MFKTNLTPNDLQEKIRREWRYCLEQYIDGSDLYDDRVWGERQCERAFTYGRAIGEMLDSDTWDEVFTDDFTNEWTIYHSLFLKSREYLNSHVEELPFDSYSPF